jgi:ubiquinone/menaquinone biosynthesis C-methylase UbiE
MRFLQAASVLLTVLPAFGQQLASESLAPYIPSPQVLVDKMLELAAVKPGEMVYDLGAGDGRIVITAAQKFAAKAVGIELHPDLYRATLHKVKMLGLENRVRIVHGNFLKIDLSPADVVTMYLLTNSNQIVKPNLEKYLKPGARVVSLDFEVRGWQPVATSHVKVGSTKHKIFLYERPKDKSSK